MTRRHFRLRRIGIFSFPTGQSFDCREVYVVDITRPNRLDRGGRWHCIDAIADPSSRFEKQPAETDDVSIEFVGSAITMEQAVQSLGIFGRAPLPRLTTQSMSVLPYTEIINKEAEIIGVSDHLAAELSALMQLACSGKLSFSQSTLRFVDLDAAQINAALDAADFTDHIRTVIVPRL